MINGVATLGVFFGLFMGYYTFVKYKRKEISSWQALGWEVIWTGIIVVVLIPGQISNFLDKVKIARALDLFLVLGMIFLLAVSFYLFVNINKQKRKHEELVQILAIKKAEKR
ncbi:DUF2304 domain-containing protein [Patescibacteria group bacterium]|nr:DUF2304 domain-containing protein [Patescibacteria group bacterium]